MDISLSRKKKLVGPAYIHRLCEEQAGRSIHMQDITRMTHERKFFPKPYYNSEELEYLGIRDRLWLKREIDAHLAGQPYGSDYRRAHR